jgi:hypothetical protein
LVDIVTKPLAGPSGDLGSIPSRRKRPGCGTDRSHPSSAVLKFAWSFTLLPHTSVSYIRYRVSSPGVKRPERGVDYPPSSDVEAKESS